MHEARLGADDLGEMRQEGDDVVLGLALDLVDPRHVEVAFCALSQMVLAAAFGIMPSLGQGVGGMRLDLEPDAEARLGLPDGSHFGSGIAGDHGRLSRLKEACSRGGKRRQSVRKGFSNDILGARKSLPPQAYVASACSSSARTFSTFFTQWKP